MSIFQTVRDSETGAVTLQESYRGCVVDINSTYHDGLTDYSGLVWDEASGQFRCAGYYPDHIPAGRVVVDASPEIMARYAAYRADLQRAVDARRQAERDARAREEEKRPARGKQVRVVRGRKVPVGTQGECIWTGEGRWGWRVGLKTAGGAVHWTAMGNVEVVTSAEQAAAKVEGKQVAKAAQVAFQGI